MFSLHLPSTRLPMAVSLGGAWNSLQPSSMPDRAFHSWLSFWKWITFRKIAFIMASFMTYKSEKFRRISKKRFFGRIYIHNSVSLHCFVIHLMCGHCIDFKYCEHMRSRVFVRHLAWFILLSLVIGSSYVTGSCSGRFTFGFITYKGLSPFIISMRNVHDEINYTVRLRINSSRKISNEYVPIPPYRWIFTR